MKKELSRRTLLRAAAALAAGGMLPEGRALNPVELPLAEFGYEQIRVTSERQTAQRENVRSVLMQLAPDSLLQPFRAMAGKPAPGTSLGGWYAFNPTYDFHHDTVGLAPGATFGQWTSALARLYASSRFGGAAGDPALAERVIALHGLLAQSISPDYFRQTRFAGYSFDKLVCGLVDAHRLAGDMAAWTTLDSVTSCALPALPEHAVPRETQWKLGADVSWMWDETYTLPANLFLAAAAGAGPRYSRLAQAYLLDETYFEPLSLGENVLGDRHAYSFVNALNSAMQAWFATGSGMHLEAAKNGFAMLEQQSFATGGWGPDELLRKPGFDELAKSLTATHNGFETPCGSYAHLNLTRSLLRATGDGRYGDSMERMLENTVLGALPLQPDGRSFYYSDYNTAGKRVYSTHRWPCCSGTLPQGVADYGIDTYLRSPRCVWVNLYQPSELRWREGAVACALEQSGSAWQDGIVRLRIAVSHPVEFALRLRLPGWVAGEPEVRVNGRVAPVAGVKGFAPLLRTWVSGDSVEVRFPMELRLQPLPAEGATLHPATVALMWGPVVLFAVREAGDNGLLTFPSGALLNAARSGPAEWRAAGERGPRQFVPFVEIGEREYSTYVALRG